MLLKYYSPMNTQGKNFVYEFCVLFTRHKIHKRNFCLVYSWVNNTLHHKYNMYEQKVLICTINTGAVPAGLLDSPDH